MFPMFPAFMPQIDPFQKGLENQLIGKHEDAIREFTHALQLNPNRLEAMHQRGLSYSLLFRLDEALQDFNRILTFNPNFIDCYLARATALWGLGRYEESLNDLERARSFFQVPNFLILYYRGCTRLFLGEYQEALGDFEASLSLNPVYSFARHQIALINCALGDWDRGFEDAKRASQGVPIDNSFFITCCYIALKRGEHSKAKEYLNQGLSIKRDAQVNIGEFIFELCESPSTSSINKALNALQQCKLHHNNTNFFLAALLLKEKDQHRFQPLINEFIGHLNRMYPNAAFIKKILQTSKTVISGIHPIPMNL
jgi:tetratricopeptide (TPR) repeat protein